MRALFFGTPAFAVPCLDALAGLADVVGVVCQPDKPVGRGLELTAPPVKRRALEMGLEVTQPTKLRTGEVAAWARAKQVDVALVVAYGRILPVDVLQAPRLGCVNVHASLLPRYRGAAPITWAVVRGERETGVTLMQMDAGMDTGPMLAKWTTAIEPDETAGELSDRLSLLGAQAVREGLPRFVRGELRPEAQDESQATVAPMLKKEDGAIDFGKSGREVHDHVRGMNPWPGAFTRLHPSSPASPERGLHVEGKVVKVHATKRSDARAPGTSPGEVVLADKTRVLVACGDGETVALTRVQLEGKKPIGAAEWFVGRGVKTGDRFEARS
jgi:methionyl-tRNA formyltransferase